MMRKILILLTISYSLYGENIKNFPGFWVSPYYNEQYLTFKYLPQIKIHINAPAIEDYDPEKPISLVLFALPNGNTIEQTVGKEMGGDTDWHYDIQHIGAQTRFLRNMDTGCNIITVYLETEQKSWPAWKIATIGYEKIIKECVEHLQQAFTHDVKVILTGHSGGGRFVFSYMDAFTDIPEYVSRICFLDSDYGYDDHYGAKLKNWLNASATHCLSVIAYNDSVALYNGQPVVSATGGTWYRSKMMKNYLDDFYPFTTDENEEIINHRALDGRISIILKKNPDRAILHTVQVERNGFIHTMLTGSEWENKGYTYYGDPVYDEYIQEEELPQPRAMIPLRSQGSQTGSEFMNKIKNMAFLEREEAIYHEFIKGNLPDFLRQRTLLEDNFADGNGIQHSVQYKVMPDYLAVGCDTNFCRIPMGPVTAQRIADFYGMSMPTSKLVDNIYQKAMIKLAPVTYAPVGNENEKVEKFILHNEAISQQFIDAQGILGQLTGGIKKDVIISNKLSDTSRDHHVVIYGWHKPDGTPIQPIYNGHINSYVDYSHGIRLFETQIMVDGEAKSIHQILRDPVMYKILSNEAGIMTRTSYISDSNLPDKPQSFGVESMGESSLKVRVKADSSVDRYHLYTSHYGSSFDPVAIFTNHEYLIEGLERDEILFLRLRAENSAGLSDYSEVLAAIPSGEAKPRALVVNGYDRSQTGNTYDFIRQHGMAMEKSGAVFDAATNEAVLDGLFSMEDYFMLDYILGDESTVDETFSGSEQLLIKNYLQQGGNLLVSGSEIAWDLDYKGSSGDQSFFYNFLKAKYSADAPGGQAGLHYTAAGVEKSIFEGLENIDFSNDNLDIRWADALTTANGSQVILHYTGVTSHKNAAVSFEGLFSNGTTPGKLVYIGFPFEMIKLTSIRNEMMARILGFFVTPTSGAHQDDVQSPQKFSLSQNYPNPFNPTTTIDYQLPQSCDVTINIYDLDGKIVRSLVHTRQSASNYQIHWDGKNIHGESVASGMYLYRLIAKSSERTYSASKKMLLLQ
ncbi:MAG: T9SS type A sorting domain-containing protein [Candidatus Marinimicrobia bacterium]|nr:T9SS type A sorting domain-containing protein [Candidatus Neomarinimicrobiota bacterium]